MLNKKVADLLNEQINKELYSAYLYLDMNNYFQQRGLNGFANWYMIQAQEERDHAMLFYQYMQNNDCKVTLDAIAKPDKVFKTDMPHHLRCRLQSERLPHHAVPRLVRQGAG